MPAERDPWVDVRTYHGFSADHVISALQKEIRRGHAENAARVAYEMCITSPALEDYLWHRLQIIAVEDIGFGEPQAALTIQGMATMVGSFDRNVGERKLYAVHAARYLAFCQKDRSSDELVNLLNYAVRKGNFTLDIPDVALDMHTAQGKAMGRGRRHFWEEGAKIHPELPGRDTSYLEQIRALLDAGELE
jgi:replication-associated recombination protein RarA